MSVNPWFVDPPATYPMNWFELDATAADSSKGSGRSVVDSQKKFSFKLSFSVDFNLPLSPQPPITKTVFHFAL